MNKKEKKQLLKFLVKKGAIDKSILLPKKTRDAKRHATIARLNMMFGIAKRDSVAI